MSEYSPGLHCLLTLETSEIAILQDDEKWRVFIFNLLVINNLERVGEAFHSFDTGGFTAAIALKESHICIHTWPEFGRLTLDIYLCNYQKDNTELVRKIATKNIAYFQAKVIQQNEIFR
jgi:S-adenosylmethionine decarboxylase